ncbi:MAG TPA: hypothetical protein PLU22_07465, partial [Polyangiaceae bacterium]|nr:hypothetical protein [Polyangiaceae bacterium]
CTEAIGGPMLVVSEGRDPVGREALITTCTGCGAPLELGDEASYARCARCGVANLVDAVPPWALADTVTGPTLAATTAPAGAAAAPPPSARTSNWPPPPPRRTRSQAALAGPAAAPRSFPAPPVEAFTEELVAIRCERCGTDFDGPVGMLHCPRCGAHHAVDAAPPWELTTIDESL